MRLDRIFPFTNAHAAYTMIGKGGGLSDMFGGGIGAQTAGSTVVEQNLDRITIVAALVFSFTTVSLGLMF